MTTEQEALKKISENKSKVHIRLIARQMGISNDYARFLCLELAKKGFIEQVQRDWYQITSKEENKKKPIEIKVNKKPKKKIKKKKKKRIKKQTTKQFKKKKNIKKKVAGGIINEAIDKAFNKIDQGLKKIQQRIKRISWKKEDIFMALQKKLTRTKD